MHIVLFGASGNIGKRILDEAVSRGHRVTAVARDPSKVTSVSPNVTKAKGDLLDAGSVASLVKDADAVVSSISPSGGQAADAISTAVRNLLKHVGGKSRFIVVGGAGSLEVAPGVQLVDTPSFPAAWKGIALAHRDALRVLENEGAGKPWTYFSPAAYIEPGKRTRSFRLGTTKLVTDARGESRISSEDYAVALIDELEKPQFVGKQFTIGY